MKRQYLKELAQGSKVDDVFMVSAREIRSTRQGDAYLALEISDRSGRLPAIQFRPSATASAIAVGTAARVQGTVTSYRGVKRVSVDHIDPARSFRPEDMLAAGTRAPDELLAEFKELAGKVRHPGLRAVLRAVFKDADFFERFSTCPGAQSNHHAHLGGLMEHTVSVARVCSVLSSLYPDVDGDLLLTAALLHDIGKVDELEFTASIEYTDEGRLIGHVVLGERRLREAISGKSLRVPSALLARLSHAMLSHHGELEWGSPKRPSTLEALLLHHADNLDAKAAGFVDAMSGASALEERWTDADNLFRRPLYAPLPLEDERPRAFREDDQYAVMPR